MTTIFAQRTCLPDGVLAPALLTIEGTRIVDVQINPAKIEADIVVPEGAVLAPGLIDIFLHGACGADVMDATPGALHVLSAYLPSEGVTGYLAATMTQSSDAIEVALANVARYQAQPKEAALLGVHLEGPFLNAEKMGAQAGEHLCDANIALFEQWQRVSGGNIRIVTLAPEVDPGLELIKFLSQHDIIASLGHSAASMAETERAIVAGAGMTTHIFNAMSGLDHREPGVVAAALLSPAVKQQLIADGVHVHPDMVRYLYHTVQRGNIVLASDAMRGKGMAPGVYDLGGQQVQVSSREARLVQNDVLAGSVLRMDNAVLNMSHFTGCDIAEAVMMASQYPADLINLTHKGRIVSGFDADLVILDPNEGAMATMCSGQWVFER